MKQSFCIVFVSNRPGKMPNVYIVLYSGGLFQTSNMFPFPKDLLSEVDWSSSGSCNIKM